MSTITLPRRLAVGLLIVVSAAVLGGGIYYGWLLMPLSLPQTASQGLEEIGSARFERMDPQRKQEYLQHTGSLMRDMTDDERREMFTRFRTDESAREAMAAIRDDATIDRIRKIAQADPAARQQMIDEMKEQIEERRKQFEERRAQMEAMRSSGDGASGPPGGEGDRPGRDGPSSDRSDADRRQQMQQRIETGNAQNGALRREMRDLLGGPDGPPRWGGGGPPPR